MSEQIQIEIPLHGHTFLAAQILELLSLKEEFSLKNKFEMFIHSHRNMHTAAGLDWVNSGSQCSRSALSSQFSSAGCTRSRPQVTNKNPAFANNVPVQKNMIRPCKNKPFFFCNQPDATSRPRTIQHGAHARRGETDFSSGSWTPRC